MKRVKIKDFEYAGEVHQYGSGGGKGISQGKGDELHGAN